jgi:glycosyltransferase involved in cell wall biosynthesis
MRDADVYIVPLRIGGGTRLKIFEAMAMGKAVVSTTIGAEGLPVADGTHLVLADDASAFADSIVALVRDPARRRALEIAARALVIDRYDWSAVAGALEDALVAMAESHASAGIPQSEVRIPQSAFRNPQSEVRIPHSGASS